MGGCFAKNRHVFFWRRSGKNTCDVLLEQMLEKTCDVCRGYKYNPADSGSAVWYWYTLPFFTGHCWVLLTMLHGIGTPYHSFLVIVTS